MKLQIIFIIFALLLSKNMYADDWPGAETKSVISNNGLYVANTIVGVSIGDVFGFKNSPKGKFASVIIHNYINDQDIYVKFSEFKLLNPISPVDILITNQGTLLTLDNWHNLGYQYVLVLYSNNGKIIQKYKLSDIYSSEKIKKLGRSKSSITWRCTRAIKNDVVNKMLKINDVLGGTLIINVINGDLEYLENSGSCGN